MRLFIAVRVTDDIISNAVKIQEQLNSPDLRIKWIEPYNMHITLKFLGEVENTNRISIENIMDAVVKKIKPFDLGFNGFGLFPNLQSPRIIWAGIGTGEDNLKQVAETLNDTLAMLNIRSEQWSFTGHLTLGRIKSGRGSEQLLTRLRNLTERSLGTMKVNIIELMESKLSAGGPEYRILKAVGLGI